jgi:hypothetical protein
MPAHQRLRAGQAPSVQVGDLDAERHLAEGGLLCRAFHQAVVEGGAEVVHEEHAAVRGPEPGRRFLAVQCLQRLEPAADTDQHEYDHHQSVQAGTEDQVVDEQGGPATQETGIDDIEWCRGLRVLHGAFPKGTRGLGRASNCVASLP